MSAVATGLKSADGIILQVELAETAPEVGQPNDVRTTLLPLVVPENGL